MAHVVRHDFTVVAARDLRIMYNMCIHIYNTCIYAGVCCACTCACTFVCTSVCMWVRRHAFVHVCMKTNTQNLYPTHTCYVYINVGTSGSMCTRFGCLNSLNTQEWFYWHIALADSMRGTTQSKAACCRGDEGAQRDASC